MNEITFFLHICVVGAFTVASLRVGKEALIAWIALQGVMANLFVLKQMELFGLTVTCSDVYAVGSFLSLNILQEFYDRAAAKKAILIAALCQGFLLVMSQFHLFYMPSPLDTTHDAFTTILTAYPRILIASLGVFYLVQNMDILIFQSLKKLLPNSSFTIRNGIGLTVSQVLDTILFSFLGLWGIVSSITDVIFVSLTIKLILVASATPLTMFLRSLKTQVEPNEKAV